MTQIKRAAVLGAGIMGSGIAAHLANAGIPTLLLDIVPPKAAEGEDTSSRAFRNTFAAGALEKLKKAKPSPMFTTRALALIEVGNLEDDLERLREVDWVVEAIIENLAIKQKLFAKVEQVIGDETLVTSNTSGLRIADMSEGRSDSFKQRFFVTHFFNPPRYMRLLELVAGEDTDPASLSAVHHFGEAVLGKGIVYGKDTTNFVANRIGAYGMMKTIAEMRKAELTVEEVDAIMGKPMGRPKSAIFRTADLVGLDTFAHVADNCYETLVDDEERDVFKLPDFVREMLERKLLGDKTGQGFYKKSSDAKGNRVILSLDLGTLEYRDQTKPRFDSVGKARKLDEPGPRAAAVMKGDDKAAKFAETVSLATLAYASRRIPEIADDLVNIDRGMRWGFSWDVGPFESWDAYGVRAGVERMRELGLEPAPWVDAMLATGRETFYAVDGVQTTYWDIPSQSAKPVVENARAVKVEYLRRGEKKIQRNAGATLWDMGDDVALLEFHTKMNSIDGDLVGMIETACEVVERDFKGLVIGNDAENFSVGANLFLVMMASQQKEWGQLRAMITGFQEANQRLYYSRFPVVCAPKGMALGGGAEITMAGNARQAAAETYIGLVEVGVGLIPGGAGNLQLLRSLMGRAAGDRDFDPFPFIRKAFLSIGLAQVATSAEEAMERGFLLPTDGISMNVDFVLSDAKARVLGMADSGFLPPRPGRYLLPGRSGRASIDALLYDMELNGQASAHDRLIGQKLATVLTGGDCSATVPVDEAWLLELEAEAFVSLCGEEKTMARIVYMLQNNKPLRN